MWEGPQRRDFDSGRERAPAFANFELIQLTINRSLKLRHPRWRVFRFSVFRFQLSTENHAGFRCASGPFNFSNSAAGP
jgi:hypothetical protein